MDHDTLGSRIEQARIAKGYTISQLSRRMAVKPSTLKNWESDRSEPRANKLSMLVGVLGISTRWLLEGGVDHPSIDDTMTETSHIAQKVEQALGMQQRLSQLLYEIEADVARLQRDLNETADSTL
ncbi:helix-turn-helix domain-containing protein [Aestuariispira ectoiniformans]|uniref:helix-turn-helix domain-containing protein n=1 Tax=Aestuariispira ectoiniformans TaxID=2775080 RepID=UPI00223AFAD5|nr:helix-turn-helix transcriptional regulator [Aestuariispira ectoiniformans]